MLRDLSRPILRRVAGLPGIASLGYALSRAVAGGTVRVVNYHGTPAPLASNLELQFQYFSRYFQPASEQDLRSILAGCRPEGRPRLLLTFDDGLASNASVAAPLLEKYGYQGWFFLPTDFIDCPAGDQREFARTHRIRLHAVEHEERVAMSWSEARELAERHVIGSHTCSHARFSLGMSSGQLRHEILESKRILGSRIGHPVSAFAWVGGETDVYTAAAQDEIGAAGYTFSFLTVSRPVTPRSHPLLLGRTNVDASWPLERVRLQLSGWTDLYYVPKHTRVLRAIGTDRHRSKRMSFPR